MEENKLNQVNYAFAAYPYVQSNIAQDIQKTVQGKDFLIWGDDNKYCNFLYELYENCAILQSVIDGTADFICGNNITKYDGKKEVNKQGDTIEDVVRKCAVDYLVYGGFALQVIKNVFNQVTEIYWVDVAKLRSDEKNEVFFYSDDWDKSLGRVKYIVYPKFGKDDQNPTSIFYYKSDKSRKTYPTPIYKGAITECEISRKISQFHLNEISNNFHTSKIINMNNGLPTLEEQGEIEKKINEKFSGSENAGRIMISFNDNKDSAVTVENLGEDGFADRYDALSKRVASQIFTAFRATPNLFGLPTETTGFNAQEYADSFKLYNRGTVRPIQKKIIDCFDKIYGVTGSIMIEPFSLENNNENVVA